MAHVTWNGKLHLGIAHWVVAPAGSLHICSGDVACESGVYVAVCLCVCVPCTMHTARYCGADRTLHLRQALMALSTPHTASFVLCRYVNVT